MFTILLLSFVIGAARSRESFLKPCKIDDSACALENGKAIFPKLIAGDPTINTDNLDPLELKEIEGKLDRLYYKFSNVTFTGLKDCDTDNVKFNPSKPNLHYDIICPHWSMTGNYVTNGEFLSTPIEGEGTYCVTSKKFRIGVDYALNKVTGDDDKDHYTIKDFNLELDPIEGINFDIKNLFNGNKELSDKMHKKVNDNWREMSKLSHGPVFNAIVAKIVKNNNKYMDLIPIEQYLILN